MKFEPAEYVKSAGNKSGFIRDGRLRERLAEEQKRKLTEYDNEAVRKRLADCLKKATA